MPCIIGFTGRHNSGKTTLICKLLPELQKKGYSIGVFKSTHHVVRFDEPGKDTALFRQAGVSKVALAGPEEIALFQAPGDEALERTIYRLFPDEDIVILEGFKNAPGIPKIEVAVNGEPELYRELNGIKAVVSNIRIEERPVIRPDDTAALVDFLEKNIITPFFSEDEVAIFINNRRLPLKLFVRNAVKGLVMGFLKSLKFTEDARKVDIRITLR